MCGIAHPVGVDVAKPLHKTSSLSSVLDDLLSLARSCVIHKAVRGNLQPSDHAPVSVELDWPPVEDDLDDDNDVFR